MSSGANVNYNLMMQQFGEAAQYHSLIMRLYIDPLPENDNERKIQNYLVAKMEKKRNELLTAAIASYNFRMSQDDNSTTK